MKNIGSMFEFAWDGDIIRPRNVANHRECSLLKSSVLVCRWRELSARGFVRDRNGCCRRERCLMKHQEAGERFQTSGMNDR